MSTIKTDTLQNVAGTKSVPVGTVVDGSAKAWVNFNGTGTVAIRAAFNVGSITDNGVGDYTVNFTTPMADANYAPAIGASPNYGASVTFGMNWASGSGTEVAPTASALRFSIGSTTAYHDAKYVSVAVFR